MRLRTLVLICCLALIVIGPAPRTHSLETFTPNKLGVHLLLDDGRGIWPTDRWAEHMRYARQAVGEWGYVTQLVRDDDLIPERWQYFMDLCAELRLTPIIRLATTFDRNRRWWRAPQLDADGTYRTMAERYATFIAALRWPSDRHYVIVHNEPNHGNEWGGRPNPAQYARFLIDVSTALRAADPNVVVLNAGFDHYAPHTGSRPFSAGGAYFMDAETFMDEMIAAYPEVWTYIDAWASHPYPIGPFTEGPWEQTFKRDLINDAKNPNQLDPLPGIYNRGVNSYEWEMLKLYSYGITGLPILITETGWRKAETTDQRSSDGGHPWPPAERAAAYIDLTLRGNNGRYPQYPERGWRPWLHDPNIIAITFFALNGSPLEWGHTNLLMLDVQGNVLGTYATLDVLERISTGQ